MPRNHKCKKNINACEVNTNRLIAETVEAVSITSQSITTNDLKVNNIVATQSLQLPKVDVLTLDPTKLKGDVVINAADGALYYSNGIKWIQVAPTARTFEPIKVTFATFTYTDPVYTDGQPVTLPYILYEPTGAPAGQIPIMLESGSNGFAIAMNFYALYFVALGHRVLMVVNRGTNLIVNTFPVPQVPPVAVFSASSTVTGRFVASDLRKVAFDWHKVHDAVLGAGTKMVLLGTSFSSIVGMIYGGDDTILDNGVPIRNDIGKLILISSNPRARNGVPVPPATQFVGPPLAPPPVPIDPSWLFGYSIALNLNYPNVTPGKAGTDPLAIGITAGSTALTSDAVNQFHIVQINRAIVGPGIPAGAVITAVGGPIQSNTATMSLPATQTGTVPARIIVAEADIADVMIINGNSLDSPLFAGLLGGPLYTGNGGDLALAPSILGPDIVVQGVARPDSQILRITVQNPIPTLTPSVFALINSYDVRAEARNLGVLTLVMNCDLDRLLPSRSTQWFNENVAVDNPASTVTRVPLARAITFAWTPHGAHSTNVDLISHMMDRFIRWPDEHPQPAGDITDPRYPFY